MYVFKSQVKSRMIRNFESRYPDLLLYLDNPYLSELVDGVFDVVSEEITNIINETVLKKDLLRR